MISRCDPLVPCIGVDSCVCRRSSSQRQLGPNPPVASSHTQLSSVVLRVLGCLFEWGR